MPFLVVVRVNDTAGNPAFYARQLRDVDFYNFIHTGILPAALDAGGPNLARAKAPILAVARDTVPPEWLQTQTEKALDAVIPYVAGGTNSFNFTVPLKDRAEAAGRARAPPREAADAGAGREAREAAARAVRAAVAAGAIATSGTPR